MNASIFKQICSILLVCAMLAPSLPLQARTRKGDKALDHGRKLEAAREYEKALEQYEIAMKEDPADIAYQLAARRTRFEASQVYVHLGQRVRTEGNLEDAMSAFTKALMLDPSSSIALQEVRRTKLMIDEENRKTGKGEASSTRGLTPGQLSRRESEERIGNMMAVPELKPINRKIPSLKMNNQPVRVLYETLGKLAGINVIFDPEYQQGAMRTHTVDLSNTTLDEALEYLSVMTKSFWKPLSSNAIFVTNDNVAKRRDHEENMVKVFYLNNMTSVQELQEVVTAVRSVLEVRRMFTYNSQNAILVRGTPDQVALVEKLLNDLDKPRAEVLIDIIVMETSTGRTRELISTLASGSEPGLRLAVAPTLSGTTTGNSTTSATTTTASSLTLARLTALSKNDFSMSLPSFMLGAVMADHSTKVKQSPQIRMADGQKGSLRVGDKVPTASGSFQPGIGSVGVSPLVNTQFQMIEVGVNVDITPHVHADEVSMHVEVEISSVKDRIDIGGIKQPIIGQRKVIDDLRLREGEMTIIGGLVQTQDTKTVSGIPGLMNIPGLRRFFSSESINKEQSELMIALVPHIVRSADITASNLKGVAAGFDQALRALYAPKKEAADVVVLAAPEVTVVQPIDSNPTAAKRIAPAPPARLTFQPTGVVTKAGSTVVVSLQADGLTDLYSAPMKVKYDPKKLKLNTVTPGAFLSSDGQRVNFSENVRNDDGEASITLERAPGTKGLGGSGAVLGLMFTALTPGKANVTITDISWKTSEKAPIPTNNPTVEVEIR